jgi:hypothetical protein
MRGARAWIVLAVLPVLILEGGCLDRLSSRNSRPNETSSDYRGLRATITRITWQDEGHARVRYCLDWINRESPQEASWCLSPLSSVLVLFWDADGEEVDTRKFYSLIFDDDFLRGSASFAADIVVSVPEDAEYLTIGLGRLQSKAKLPRRKDKDKGTTSAAGSP